MYLLQIRVYKKILETFQNLQLIPFGFCGFLDKFREKFKVTAHLLIF